MTKKELAAEFFVKLGEDSGDFIATMIEAEMDFEIIELFNQFGGQLSAGQMDPDRFKASLLIIGYLVRAHEEAKLKEARSQDQNPGADHDPCLH